MGLGLGFIFSESGIGIGIGISLPTPDYWYQGCKSQAWQFGRAGQKQISVPARPKIYNPDWYI